MSASAPASLLVSDPLCDHCKRRPATGFYGQTEVRCTQCARGERGVECAAVVAWLRSEAKVGPVNSEILLDLADRIEQGEHLEQQL